MCSKQYQLLFVYLFLLIILSEGCQTSSVSTTQSVQSGDKLSNANDYQKAIIEYEDFLKESAGLGIYRNYERESDVCRKLAYAYSTRGNHNKSLEYLQMALRIDSVESKDKLKVIEDLRLIGITHSYLGNFTDAKRSLNRSLANSAGMEKSAKNERKRIVADTKISLAHVELAMGNYSDASLQTKDALKIYDQISGEYLGKIEGFLLIGNILLARDEIDKALNSIKQSMELAEINGLNTSRQLNSLSEAYKIRGEFEESLNARLNALEEARRSNIIPQVIWSLLRVGDAYEELGVGEKAEEYYKNALELQTVGAQDTTALLPSIQLRMGNVEQASNLWNRSGSSLGAGIAHLRLGNSYRKKENMAAAKESLLKAKGNFEKLGNREGLANTNLELSQVLIGSEEFGSALHVIDEAFSQTEQSATLWQLWYQKGICMEAMGDTETATKAYTTSIEIIENLRGSIAIEEFRSSFFDDKTVVYDRLINLLIKRSDMINLEGKEYSGFHQAFLYNEKARSRTFLDLLGNTRINHKQISDSVLLKEEQALRIKVSQLSQQIQRNNLNGLSQKQVEEELITAQNEYQQLVQRIKLQNQDYFTMVSVDPPSLEEIQNSIKSNTALVEYWVGERATLIWVIEPDGIKHKVLSIGKADLKRYVKAARNGIKFQLVEETKESFQSLYQELIKPVESWLKDYENLGIIPHGPLHFLPFQALIDSRNNYLIESKNLFYAPSASVYYFTKKRKAVGNEKMLSLALGNSSIGGYGSLPGTEFEVTQIAQFYDDPVTRSGNENQESFFKNNASKYETIHVATHGVLSDKQPLYSYLLMSPTEKEDGRLTVHEIMDMNINSGIVTLSACETGLGELDNGDELVGLSRAFLFAGTKAVIVSLWTVDDLSTSVLMTKFYHFLSEGMSPEKALAEAQRALMEDVINPSQNRGGKIQWEPSLMEFLEGENKFKDHPYYWAPFILIGTD